MANISKTPSGKHKATIRRSGWPTSCKSFRTKQDAEDWARGVEDEMVRGVYINRAPAERLTVEAALQRYLAEITISKRPTTQAREKNRVKPLLARLGKYSNEGQSGSAWFCNAP